MLSLSPDQSVGLQANEHGRSSPIGISGSGTATRYRLAGDAHGKHAGELKGILPRTPGIPADVSR